MFLVRTPLESFFGSLKSEWVHYRVFRIRYEARANLMALFNILVQWHGFQPDENGFVPLSIAEFSL